MNHFPRETENTPEWVLWGENWYGLVVRGDVRKFYGRTIGFGGKWIPCSPPWSGGQRRHLSPEYLNHGSPAVTVPWAASVRADWLPHHPAPMVERPISLSVRQTGDDAVVAHLTPLFVLGGGCLLRNPVAESLEYFFLSAENPSKSLSSHIGPQPKSDEASAGKFRVVCRGKCTVRHSHL